MSMASVCSPGSHLPMQPPISPGSHLPFSKDDFFRLMCIGADSSRTDRLQMEGHDQCPPKLLPYNYNEVSQSSTALAQLI